MCCSQLVESLHAQREAAFLCSASEVLNFCVVFFIGIAPGSLQRTGHSGSQCLQVEALLEAYHAQVIGTVREAIEAGCGYHCIVSLEP